MLRKKLFYQKNAAKLPDLTVPICLIVQKTNFNSVNVTWELRSSTDFTYQCMVTRGVYWTPHYHRLTQGSSCDSNTAFGSSWSNFECLQLLLKRQIFRGIFLSAWIGPGPKKEPSERHACTVVGTLSTLNDGISWIHLAQYPRLPFCILIYIQLIILCVIHTYSTYMRCNFTVCVNVHHDGKYNFACF